jgi:hypothetical protein
VGIVLVLALAPAGLAHAQDPEPEPPRRAAIREQARGLLAARLKSDVGLSDAQVADVLPRIEAIEEARREARRSRLRLLGDLRRDLDAGAPDAKLQGSLDALDRNERDEDRATRDGLARLDAALTVPQRVRVRFLLVQLRGEISRQVQSIRQGRRGPR